MPYLDEAVVKTLKILRLKDVAKRLLSIGPAWLRQLDQREIRAQIRNRVRLVLEDQLKRNYESAITLLRLDGIEIGDYLEFGVYNGTSLACMFHVMEKLQLQSPRLIGFDSFEGLPAIAATDSGGHWPPGEFKSSYEFAVKVLDSEGIDWNRTVLVKGLYDSTLTAQRRKDLGTRKASIIMVDCDLYQSAKEALWFCEPLIVDKSVVFFDDWYPLADRGLGEKLAFEEFLAAFPDLRSKELYHFPPHGKTFLVTRVSSTAERES